jgi:protein-S-isoprenylcysteine O-methyltransferase Ste14
MAWTLRKIRLRLVWLLVIPFLWFARTTPTLLAVGGVLAVAGLVIRAWAAGFIRKEQALATDGPYGHTRNPLYLGSFFLGLGITLAGGQWIFVVAFAVFFVLVYRATMLGEAELLEGLFGDEYRHYAEHVPLFLPRLTPYRSPYGEEGGRFTMERYSGNKEYEALLGAVAGFGFLAARMLLG